MCEKYNTVAFHPYGGGDLLRPIGGLWPPTCVICRRAGEPGIDLCRSCLDELPRLAGPDGALCPRCGEWLGGGRGTAVCRHCAGRPSPFARLVVPWRYAFPLDALIGRMKYRDERVLARVLGTALAREAARVPAAVRPELLVAVPSRAERRESGFDHAASLTRWCAREARVPDGSSLARRIVDTGALAGLSRAARADRIRGAFRVDDRVAGRRIAIVDDVLTSGATAGELARELYDTCAASVELWVLARTPAER